MRLLFFDKKIFNFLAIIFLSFITVAWTFYIFKRQIDFLLCYFLVATIFLRCFFSFLLFRDYIASWRKSTPKTFLRKIFINFPVFVFVVILFYGKLDFALIFSEFLFYLFLINLSVYLYWYFFNKNSKEKTKTTIIYGAGSAGIRIFQEFAAATKYQLRYFVDDNFDLQKRSIDGKRVLSRDQLKHKLQSCKFDLLVVALPSAARKVIRKICNDFEKDFKQIRILPSLDDVLQNKSFLSQLKPVSVYDLLAREPKNLDKDKISNFIKNKTILVTGAGGSIGSEIARQCVKYSAKNIILLDHSEFNLYKISEYLEQENIKSILCSVCDKDEIKKIFKKYSPDIVFHAAAYKHVSLVEENASKAIHNNIMGTKNIIDLAIDNGVDSFILISTDKAVRPTNVMGATKRVCELYLQNVDSKSTKLAAVRFGNVLGSSGSVVPKFEEQIKKGGPLTVTHPEVTRYFMLISEACELVLQAGAMAKNSEVFVLNMGKSVKIIDLARRFKNLAGRDNVEIKIIGLRPGEKLYEELLVDEADVDTQYKDIFVGRKTFYNIDNLNKNIELLMKNNSNQLKMLQKIVPEFDHNN